METRGDAIRSRVEALYHACLAPGFGRITDAADPAASPAGDSIAFTAITVQSLTGGEQQRIALVDAAGGVPVFISAGPDDSLPRWSPDSNAIAFLSGSAEGTGLSILRRDGKGGWRAESVGDLGGNVEDHRWSPDGRRILLTVAGHGADLAGMKGGVATPRREGNRASWEPLVDEGGEDWLWRAAWVLDLATGERRSVSLASLTVWEAVWCGNNAVAAIVSPAPQEGAWYSARLVRISLGDGTVQTLHVPGDQIGLPAASPSGNRVAAVEALCSDRGLVAGVPVVIDTTTGASRHLGANGIAVTCIAWVAEDRLMVAGHRGFETVVARIDLAGETTTELWSSRALSCGVWYPVVSAISPERFALILEGHGTAPTLAVGHGDTLRTVATFSHPGTLHAAAHAGAAEEVVWQGEDGVTLEGWLIRPAEGNAPFPLIMDIHGGPVWAHRPRWCGRGRTTPLLPAEGYAVFRPNPRGSGGREQDFTRALVGDVGGIDARDCLAGLEALVAQRLADPTRIGVTGGSYGGYLTSRLITLDTRFAAAVAVAPITDWYSQHRTSQIPHFDRLFLGGNPSAEGGAYHDRSPVMAAHRARTPTLFVAGAHDRNTPPTQALEFCRSLREAGVEAAMLTYPEEGHGIRHLPAAIDLAARTAIWFDRHMPART
ncbi:MAG: S9 family peptidase [Sphingosinicella sp.]|nr:S9 family peptidase [Sphingosinicella sp.]